jgi:hypothetical protein
MPDGHKTDRNDHIIYQHLPSQHPPKFTKIGIFWLKTNHLATQLVSVVQLSIGHQKQSQKAVHRNKINQIFS